MRTASLVALVRVRRWLRTRPTLPVSRSVFCPRALLAQVADLDAKWQINYVAVYN